VNPAPFEASAARINGNVQVVAVRGELDLSTAPALEKPLEDAVSKGGASLLIDLSSCEFIDSTGIALIVRVWKRLEGGGGGGRRRIAICCANEQVLRVLEVTGLELTIPVHPTREAALAALRD
jgi:anti-sigma B factor antagonist